METLVLLKNLWALRLGRQRGSLREALGLPEYSRTFRSGRQRGGLLDALVLLKNSGPLARRLGSMLSRVVYLLSA